MFTEFLLKSPWNFQTCMKINLVLELPFPDKQTLSDLKSKNTSLHY